MVVPDDAFPIAKDDNARAKAMVDLVTLQVNMGHQRRQIRHARVKQSTQPLPHSRAGMNTVQKTASLEDPWHMTKCMDPAAALPFLYRCIYGNLLGRI